MSEPDSFVGWADSEVLLAHEQGGTTKLTCIQQQFDCQVVISQNCVVQSCAALEVCSDVETVVEVILPGDKDCRGQRVKAQLTERTTELLIWMCSSSSMNPPSLTRQEAS